MIPFLGNRVARCQEAALRVVISRIGTVHWTRLASNDERGIAGVVVFYSPNRQPYIQ